ncbi:DUF4082 domain-containing protein [Thermoactinospora rubra]|uniref:DUF4082 domain-containing protein n=1 Tax=Thermoactinospora rubra TaxID=1088767 RepID=UPI0011805F7E|nr:DUF4082 domain-containing protein [Thermoactinospora rubra]
MYTSARLLFTSLLGALFGAAFTVLGLSAPAQAQHSQGAAPCDPGNNPVVCENSKTGTPPSQWERNINGGDTIEGFATQMSVNVGQTVHFKIRTPATSYRIDIYRMGYYGGDGARKIATISPSASLPQTQPDCLTQAATGLVDCGTWAVSASWAVPSTAVSGVYFAHLTRTDGVEDDNHIVFVVRDDAGHSDMLFQTSDTTWQAYNDWGGNSFYTGTSQAASNRAVKLSYNRPFASRENTPWGRDFVFANEYPMIRWLEANGYDVSYTSGADVDRAGQLLLNHKIFLSVGHDEYWSKQQRANVEAARGAGVNLAFFSGNEVFWKTRWENSADGSGTPYRTLVTYKETHANAKTDPSAEWTGTWRDPRFTPPADGAAPENALTGQLFAINCCTGEMKVPAADGKMRFWRNTSIASLGSGETATLPDGVLGYEWDLDPDNGHRPAGLFRLSTTTATAEKKLKDWGNTYVREEATHHLTMYRAPSGALVFGAGTVQWSWGLDPEHDGDGPQTADVRMQQATVNLFADMGVQPGSLRPGLTAATKSTDTTAPATTIDSPGAGAELANGATVTVSGTASDTGGRVAAVEVSTDGGATWHPATGRGSWTYTWHATGNGPVTIKARAVDDSGNLESTPAGRSVTVKCPCTLFGSGEKPETASAATSLPHELGVKFRAAVNGWITGVRFYKGANNTGTHTGSLWDASGNRLATATFTGETATGWQTVSFPVPVPVTAGTTYVASYYAPNGGFAADNNWFQARALSRPPLTGLKDGADGPNGVYRYGSSGFPAPTYQGANYWVDPVFSDVEPPDTRAPLVTARTPYPGSTSVPVTVRPSLTFDEAVTPSSPAVQLTVDGGAAVSGSFALDAAGKVLTFTPAANLAHGTTYRFTVSGAKDAAGNAAATEDFTFTTAKATPEPGVCPCSVWPDSAVPAVASASDTKAVTLGVKFTADQSGSVTGLRFYKGPGNDGPHVGALWTASGTKLAEATFAGESTAGWQQVTFSSPVTISANTTYVASYHAPVGRYSYTWGQFGSAGVANPPLRVPQNGGLYAYGNAGTFPATSSPANYWVDVVYKDNDADPPTVSAVTPLDTENSVPVTTAVTATLSEPIQPGTAQFTLSGGVTGSVSYASATRTLTFTPPAALAAGTTYTATISGAKDSTGNQMAPFSWTFTTAKPAPASGVCPCSVWPDSAVPAVRTASDTKAVALGVKFTADRGGVVTGVRFYKGPGNTGTHVGALWTASGTKLAEATFAGESAAGWQQVTFSSPVTISANTTYVASYHAPVGRYSYTWGQFGSAGVSNPPLRVPQNGGLYAYGNAGTFPATSSPANYWVDVVFSAVDSAAPQVVSANPLDTENSVPTSTTVTATFGEELQPGTAQLSVAGVAGTSAYDAATKTITFTPASALAPDTSYTATVSGAKDTAGNEMAPVTLTFRTAKPDPQPGVCPCSVWTDGSRPAVRAAASTDPVTLGMRFTADQNGSITGLRFYKGPGNTGTHVGALWSADGVKLAEATFTGETAAGWQEVTFSTPVPITAGTTYVASYHALAGRFSYTWGQLSSPYDKAPLRATGGAYLSGADGFPSTDSPANYWVDVVFSP